MFLDWVKGLKDTNTLSIVCYLYFHYDVPISEFPFDDSIEILEELDDPVVLITDLIRSNCVQSITLNSFCT